MVLKGGMANLVSKDKATTLLMHSRLDEDLSGIEVDHSLQVLQGPIDEVTKMLAQPPLFL